MRKLDQQTFIMRSTQKHGYKYDYSLVAYINQDTKVIIKCPIHGEFQQRPADHMLRTGCPDCGKIQADQNRSKWNADRFFQEADKVHNQKFDYDRASFTRIHEKIRFRCSIHGWREVNARNHLKGIGCQRCAGKGKKTVEEVKMEAKSVHNSFYSYDHVTYINTMTPVDITCPIHGDFKQTPAAHINMKQRCPRCASYGASKVETEWLDTIGLPNTPEFRNVRRDGFCFDGYEPKTNTVYEFYGDFWHGNPRKFKSEETNHMNKKTFGELYENTLNRESKILNLGYNLITIWESDFRN